MWTNELAAEKNIEALLILGSYIGIIYTLSGSACGWAFIYWITKETFFRCLFQGLMLQCISSFASFIAMPMFFFTLFRSTFSWRTALFAALFTGIPQCVTDVIVLRFWKRKWVKVGDIWKLLLWRLATFILCVLVAAPIIVLYFSDQN